MCGHRGLLFCAQGWRLGEPDHLFFLVSTGLEAEFSFNTKPKQFTEMWLTNSCCKCGF
jgi:hypothetical protein